jgi:hypothetical protein
MSERRRIPTAEELEKADTPTSPIRRLIGGISRFRVRHGVGELRTSTRPTPILPPVDLPHVAQEAAGSAALVAVLPERADLNEEWIAAPPADLGSVQPSQFAVRRRTINIAPTIKAERGASSEPSDTALDAVRTVSPR